MIKHRILLLFFTLLVSSSALAKDWVDNWFDNAVYDQPTSFQSQKRGYFSAGGFSARLNSTTDYPVSITPPKLNIGCGGIDAFLGGVSFLDKDYLVDKVQGIMQAAPYVALDMALKIMCKECSETLKAAENAVDMLNNIQLNECKMSKPIATAAVNRDASALGGMWTEMTGTKDLNDAKTRMWGESTDKIKANNNSPTTDIKTLTKTCPRKLQTLMEDGSLLEHIADNVGMKDLTDSIRGYIGDVLISAKEGDKVIQASRMLPCPKNDVANVDDMLYGQSYKMNKSGVCSKASGKSVATIVTAKLIKVSEKIQTGDRLTASEESFVTAAQFLPVYSILRQAQREGTMDETVDTISNLVALQYTYMIFNDMYRNAEYSLQLVQEASQTTSTIAGAKEPCNTKVYQNVVNKLGEILESAYKNKQLVQDRYNAQLAVVKNNLEFTEIIRNRANDLRARASGEGAK